MRRLVEAEKDGYSYWGCSACTWIFVGNSMPVGDSIEEMIANYYAKRDRSFALHSCSEYPINPRG